MITITISGPRDSGKTILMARIAEMLEREGDQVELGQSFGKWFRHRMKALGHFYLPADMRLSCERKPIKVIFEEQSMTKADEREAA